MPLYEYRCDGCGHRFEVLQRMGEGGEDLLCPRCGAERPARQLSTFAAASGASAAASGASALTAGGCGGGSGFT
ncbi:MAG TPA: zinc ribbon domain-containing protein [Thermoanaerobaculia bacterium]|nr:zinc ribbon domain-containing protein [Thermoanaerobaculia bacterium]